MGHRHEHRPYISRREFLKRSGTVGLAAGLASTTGPWIWRQLAYAADAPVDQAHLTFGADAARQMAVSWLTPAPVTRPFVELAGVRFEAETVQYDGYPGFLHHARLDGLEPATPYRYRIGHDDTTAADDRLLTTAPAGPEPFTFTAFGDQGVDDLGNGGLTQPPTQASANTELARSFGPAFHAVVGDLAYANGNQTLWDSWFRMIEPMAAAAPWMPCIGNHEIEQDGGIGGYGVGDAWGDFGYDAYRSRFLLPDNGHADLAQCFYAFRYGSVQFLSLDNNDVNTEVTANIGYTNGRQQAWAERTLAAAAVDPRIDFIIVLMHQCAFSSSSKHGSDTGVRDAWWPLFARYGVDLVVQGHDHVYERTHLMDHEAVVADGSPYVAEVGTLYVTCGNGGSVQEPFSPSQPAWSAFRQDFKVGTLKVDVDPGGPGRPKRLTLSEYWALDGSPIEEGIVLERPAAPLPAGVAPPDAEASPQEPVARAAPHEQPLPATGGGAGITAVGVAALAGAAAATATVLRREATEEETTR